MRPREVLLRAVMEDLGPVVDNLRRIGWPAEVIAVAEDDWFGVRLQIRLDQMPVPVETTPT